MSHTLKVDITSRHKRGHKLQEGTQQRQTQARDRPQDVFDLNGRLPLGDLLPESVDLLHSGLCRGLGTLDCFLVLPVGGVELSLERLHLLEQCGHVLLKGCVRSRANCGTRRHRGQRCKRGIDAHVHSGRLRAPHTCPHFGPEAAPSGDLPPRDHDDHDHPCNAEQLEERSERLKPITTRHGSSIPPLASEDLQIIEEEDTA